MESPPRIIEGLVSSNGAFVDDRMLASGIRVGVARGTTEDGLVVRDPEMESTLAFVDLVADSNLAVLLCGETGVGKEVIATRLHERSPRRLLPLVKLNCAAIVESQLGPELFGYERAGFTGAGQAKPGLFERAGGGTLFLDAVGELPLAAQATLSRVLESGKIARTGTVKRRPIDVQIVSATNRNLHELMATGRFRADLFFRLDGVSIFIPPLRARTSEIPDLAEMFVADACATIGRPSLPISDAAMVRLQGYRWPGNIRELRNLMLRTVVLCTQRVIDVPDLRFETVGASGFAARPSPTPPPTPTAAGRAIPAEERVRISRALNETAGNQTRAAKLLGYSRRTLLKKLDRLDLPRPRKSTE